MSCEPKGERQQNNDWTIPRKRGRWESVVAMFFGFAIMAIMAYWISGFWAEDVPEDSRRNWKQLSGNDGKLWKGIPDNDMYAGTEGAVLTVYYQYFYDGEGRLSKVNTFHRHDGYRDVYNTQYREVWALSNVETYEYDSRGRVSRRSQVQGDTQTVYEYTGDGYTETQSWAYAANGRISKYDSAGNRIYFRNADNYRYPHVTTWEYDGKNRPVRKTLEVEGKEPYGVPTHVIWAAEYDEEAHTSVETEYDSQGDVIRVWHCSYDEDWNKTESFWYEPEKVPGGYSAEECRDYYTKGYWVSSSGGRILEKMENDPWKETRNDSEYTAYDYDGRGNCISELKIYSAGFARLSRYVYDDAGRLTEQFNYDFDDVRFWEQRQSDGSMLTLEVSDDKVLSITRTALDGTLSNRFVYGEDEVDTQQTPEGIVRWQLNPALILAEKGPRPGQTGPGGATPGNPEGTGPGGTTPGNPEGTGPGGTTPEDPGDTEKPPGQEQRPKKFLYTVQKGDCLWTIAEEFYGDGRRYVDIYRWNSDVIGDDPRLILPEVRLYIELP